MESIENNGDTENATLPNQFQDFSLPVLDSRQIPFSPTSPGHSPGRPRTMKEYEEELSNLKKENFNLQVRIYFLEEHRVDLNLPKEVEELRDLYTKLKLEFEVQKKDLETKENLLLDTFTALDVQKQELDAVKEEKLDLQKRIDSLEKELKDYHIRFMETSIPQLDDTNALYAMTFGMHAKPEPPKSDPAAEEKIKDLETELCKEREQVLRLQEEVDALTNTNTTNKEHARDLKARVDDLETKLAKFKEDSKLLRVNYDRASSLLSEYQRKTSKHGDILRDKDAEGQRWKSLAEELRKQLSNVQSELQKIQDSRHGDAEGQRWKSLAEELRKQLSNVQSELQKIQDRYRKREKQVKILYAENTSLREEVRRLEQLLEKGTSRSQSCEQERELRDTRRLMQQFLSEDQYSKDGEHNQETRLIQHLIKENKKLNVQLEEMKGIVRKLSSNHTDSSKEEVSRLIEAEKEISADKDKLISELQSKVEELTRIVNEKAGIHHSLLNSSQSEAGRSDSNLKIPDDNQAKQNKDNETLEKQLLEKNTEIESLKKELRKKTFNLQGLVNKELWDKNREIEKLNKLCERQHVEVLSLEKQLRDCHVTLMQDKVSGFGSPMAFQRGIFDDKENLQPITDSRAQILCLMEDKRQLQRKVEELQVRLLNTPERDKESEQIQALRAEKELVEKQRKEAVNACVLLTTRLQELADFLDSLLPTLCGKKRKYVQQAVERSRELSRSLTLAAEESSLLQCSTWTDLQPSLVIPLLPDISTVDFWSGDEAEETFSPEEEVNKTLPLTAPVETTKHLADKSRENNPFLSSIFNFDEKNFSIGNNAIDENQFFENIADMTEGSLVETFSEQNAVEKIQNTSASPEVRSANIGQITLSSKKKDGKISLQSISVAEASKPKECDGLSECETWSEPDRDVSYARMGLKEDPAVLNKSTQFGFADTSETADSAPKSPLSRRGSEIHRLQRKIRNLEQVNAALRSELVILHQLTPPTLSRQDKATSIELSRQSTFSVPVHLLEEIRNQREKLEASLFHNDYIRRQLESTVSSLQRNQGEQDKALLDRLKEVSNQLEVAENEATKLKVDKITLNSEVDSLQSALQQTSDKLQEKQRMLEELETETACRLREVEESYNKKLFKSEQKCVKLEQKALELEKEKSELTEKIKELNDQISVLTKEIESYVLEGKKNKQLNDDLNIKIQQINRQKDELQRLTAEQEQLLADAERERQELATQLIARDREVSELSKRLSNVELTSGELEAALRSQLELATQQCAQFEAKIRDLDCCQKRREGAVADLQRRLDAARFAHSEAVLQYTRVANDNIRLQQELRTRQHTANAITATTTNQMAQVERMKGELEHRVAELEAANVELEAKLTSLNVVQHPFSDYDTDTGSNVVGSPRVRNLPPPLILPSSPPRPLPLTSPSRSHDHTSDYLSDQDAALSSPQSHPRGLWYPASPHSHMSASPDLGIESDHGRFSSLDTQPSKSTTASMRGIPPVKDLMKLEEENTQLRLNLQKTRHALEETLAHLTAANQHKRQYEAQLSAANQHKAKVERAICRQLHKTHSILKKARVNLEEDGKSDRC